MEYQIYLQHKLAPEIGSLEPIFQIQGFCFSLQNNPKFDLSPLLRPTEASPPETRPARGLVLLRARARLRRPCARCARLRVVRAVVRSRVWWRAVACCRPPGSGRGAKEERESLSGRGLGFRWIQSLGGKDTEKKKEKSFSQIPNVGVGVF